MRVLHIYNGKLYGGVETMLSTLARLRGACPGMEPTFALCYEGRLSRELQAAGAVVHQLGEVRIRWPLSIWQARRRVRDLLRSTRFDAGVCHMPWAKALFGPVVRSEGLPLVFWLHDVSEWRHWLERWARLSAPDFGLTNSRFLEGQFAKHFPGVPSEVLYLPVEAPERAPGAADRLALRRELATPDDAVVVVQVSRMEDWKGHRLHLAALSRLKAVPGWVCWLVGGTQRPHEVAYRADLERMARELGISDRIRFTGERTDVPRILAAADIFCQPNLFPEGIGYAFPKAFYAGLPVVTTDMGGAREIVDASCGALTAPGDTGALSQALGRLFGDRALRQKMGRAGLEKVGKLFDAKSQVKALGEILEKRIHPR